MNRINYSRRVFQIVGLMISSILITATGCKDDEPVDRNSPAYHIAQFDEEDIPDHLVPDAPYTEVKTLYATGCQIYRAQQKQGSNPIAYEWIFVSPVAELYNEKNKLVGSHFAGPTWHIDKSESTINAQAFRSSPADPGNIDWLLLQTRTGTTPTGELDGVDYVQRVATTEGVKPADPNGLVGEICVKYTAIYRFLKLN